MKRQLPPLNALKVFEVAGQLKNFSQAAETMCITQSAVSKQVKVLEENLDIRLFHRQERGVQLTESGKRLLDIVSLSLGLLEVGVKEFYSAKDTQTLTVNITPSMSAKWILQRVKKFRQSFPDIMLNIKSDELDINWENLLDTDLAVRILPRDNVSSDAELIVAESMLLIASPNTVADNKISSVEDILQHNLIFNSSRQGLWEHFFKQYKLNAGDLYTSFGCQHVHMTIDAAAQGMGLALAPKILCEEFLATGQLINPLGIELDSGHGYYFLSPSYKRNSRNVQIFYRWLRSQLVPVSNEKTNFKKAEYM